MKGKSEIFCIIKIMPGQDIKGTMVIKGMIGKDDTVGNIVGNIVGDIMDDIVDMQEGATEYTCIVVFGLHDNYMILLIIYCNELYCFTI